jgi:hypothetical protein
MTFTVKHTWGEKSEASQVKSCSVCTKIFYENVWLRCR